MKIPHVNSEIGKYVNESTHARTNKPTHKTSLPTDVSRQAEADAIVTVSERSKEVLKAQGIIESEPDVRLEKVRAIKEKIENQTYEMDYDKTAENILKTFLDESL